MRGKQKTKDNTRSSQKGKQLLRQRNMDYPKLSTFEKTQFSRNVYNRKNIDKCKI